MNTEHNTETMRTIILQPFKQFQKLLKIPEEGNNQTTNTNKKKHQTKHQK